MIYVLHTVLDQSCMVLADYLKFYAIVSIKVIRLVTILYMRISITQDFLLIQSVTGLQCQVASRPELAP